jgi:hypothetical protein
MTTMHRRLILLSLCVALLAACGETSSYELRWTIGCTTGKACKPRSVRECAEFGLDSVHVEALVDVDSHEAVFPCYTIGDGAVGRGPDLPPGPVTLKVRGLSPGGISLTTPAVSVGAQIPDTGLVPVTVDLPIPPLCGDGVDNDGDGLVDLLDPDCEDTKDTDERS